MRINPKNVKILKGHYYDEQRLVTPGTLLVEQAAVTVIHAANAPSKEGTLSATSPVLPKVAAMTPYQFFLRHAGFSYDPKTETTAASRRRSSAHDLANAERRASAAGMSFGWSIDPDIDSSEWCDDPPAYDQWVCICRDAHGNIAASLGGIDFGRDGSPYSDPYRRVVEAELAQEALT